jgi:hypothetical protein
MSKGMPEFEGRVSQSFELAHVPRKKLRVLSKKLTRMLPNVLL